ncbi:MAG: DUF5667 domain-containing protein [Patescibacteria group bacterium]
MKIIKSILISLLFVPFFVFAQNQVVLPSAGLTPESSFYFLDTLGEALREFFTFTPERKAHLQIAFANERVAEIKIILETKGVEARGLEVAQSRLQVHLGNATEIIVKEKSKGKDVSKLAKELDDEFKEPKSALAKSFKAEKRTLKVKEDELKAQLKIAHRASDTSKAEALAEELGQVKVKLELLKLKEENIEDELKDEEEKLEEEMEAEHKAKEVIGEAEEEKQKLLDEVTEEGVGLPANAFVEFENLLTQAKSAFQASDFVEAKNLAKRAKKSLDRIKKVAQELNEEQEKEEERSEEAQKQIGEAEKKRREIEAETRKKGGQIPASSFEKYNRLLTQAKELFAKGNYVGAEQLAKQAKASLENVKKGAEQQRETQKQEDELIKKDKELQSEADKKFIEETRERQKQEEDR